MVFGSFEDEFDNAILTEAVNSDGEKGVAVLNSDQSELMAIVNPAWAKDATGRELETHFEIRDNVLIQHVSHQDENVQYPVVADPYVYYYWLGRYNFYNRVETNNIMMGNVFFSGAAGYYALTGLPGVALAGAAAVVMSLQAGYAEWIYNRGNCVGLRINYWTPGTNFWFFEHGGYHCY